MTQSWIITEKATGKAVFETFIASVAAAINTDKYQVWEVGEYLADLNRRIRAENAQ